MNTVMETVGAVCNQVRSKSKHGSSFQNLLVLVRREFRLADFNLKIKSTRDKTLETKEFYVNAYYDAEDDQNKETPIEVVVHHNFDNTVLWDPLHTTDFLIQIFDATVHEFRHRYQSIRRGHRQYEEHCDAPYWRYLANDDELDAYSFSIAIELLRTMDAERAKRRMAKISVLSKMRTGPNYSSPQLRSYIEHFGINHLTKRLAKKVYYHLETIDKRYVFL